MPAVAMRKLPDSLRDVGRLLQAGLALAASIGIGPEAAAQTAVGGTTRLPGIEVSAPAVRRKPAIGRASRSQVARAPAAIRTSATTNSSSNSSSNAGAQAPVTSSSE